VKMVSYLIERVQDWYIKHKNNGRSGQPGLI
jgi:hypothetical protein